MELITKNGYNLYEISSMLQKAIRRSDVRNASYAVNEMSFKFRKYMWKRLYISSVEDCYGIITKEIVALKNADDFVTPKSDLFIAKAVVLLCLARKNRDADYVACNFMYSDRTLTDEEYDKYVDYKEASKMEMQGTECLPDYVFDCHTLKGKIAGKTKLDMIQTEQKALNPYQQSLFDEGDWSEFFKHFPVEKKEMEKLKKFQKGKKLDPSEN